MTESEYNYLDNLMIKHSTDKSSLHHDYSKAYSIFFSPFREKKIKFLEIGIDNCYSVKLWEDYFPQAELHFIDIQTSYSYKSQRSHYHVADQKNP